MTRKPRHTDESAVTEYAHVDYETRIVERTLAILDRKKKNEYICSNVKLVRKVSLALQKPNFNMKQIARDHKIPHHTVVYIWRKQNDNP